MLLVVGYLIDTDSVMGKKVLMLYPSLLLYLALYLWSLVGGGGIQFSPQHLRKARLVLKLHFSLFWWNRADNWDSFGEVKKLTRPTTRCVHNIMLYLIRNWELHNLSSVMESTSMGWHFILEKNKPYHTILKLIIPSLLKLNYFISASTSSRCEMFVRKAPITNLEIIIPGPGNKKRFNKFSTKCEHVLTAVKLSSTKRFDSIQDVWDSLQSRSKFTKVSIKSNSNRLTEELHERFSKATIDGTSSMFIFNALILSLTRPNFFSRAIIEPRVQTPLPAPPDTIKCSFSCFSP